MVVTSWYASSRSFKSLYKEDEMMLGTELNIKEDIREHRWRELLASHRYAHIWYARGRKTLHFSPTEELPIEEVHARIVDALRKLYFPMIPRDELDMASRRYETTSPPTEEELKVWEAKRKERISALRDLEPEEIPLDKIDAIYVSSLEDEEVVALWKRLEHLYKTRGMWEDLYNASVFVGTELYKRSMWADYRDSELGRVVELPVEEYPSPAGLSEKLSLEELFAILPSDFDLSLPPPAMYLTGRIVNQGVVEKPLALKPRHDVDILVRGPWDRRIIHELLLRIPPEIGRGLHFNFNPVGPMIGYSVPVYKQAFHKYEDIEVLSPWVREYIYLSKLQLFKPFVPLKPRSGLLQKNEFYTLKDMWEVWVRPRIEEGLLVEPKWDGRRFQIHLDREAGKVALYTEDNYRDRAPVLKPLVDELLEKLRCKNAILDGEICVYELFGKEVTKASEKVRLGELVPREDTASITSGEQIPPRLWEGLVLVLYDIVYLDGEVVADRGALERYRLLRKIVPEDCKYIFVTPAEVVYKKEDFVRAMQFARSNFGSEGAVVKEVNSVYPIKWKGENRTNQQAKFKNLKEVDLLVYKVVQKRDSKTGKPIPGQYMYEVAFGIPANRKDEFWGAFEWNGKWYAPLGRTYSTAVKCEVGDIVTVLPIRIREYQRDGKRAFTFMFPTFKEKHPSKKEPDGLVVIERLAEVGTGPLPEEEALTLEPCPYFDHPQACPLYSQVAYPMNPPTPAERAGLPIRCLLSLEYKCRYAKPYYWEEEPREIDENIDEDMLLEEGDGYAKP